MLCLDIVGFFSGRQTDCSKFPLAKNDLNSQIPTVRKRSRNFFHFICIWQEERGSIHFNDRLLLKSHNALVLELTVPEEEPIGSLMRIIPTITGLVTGDPAAEPSGVGGGADSAGGGANRKPDAYYPTNHRPCYRGSCR